jgi:hypothetical protein
MVAAVARRVPFRRRLPGEVIRGQDLFASGEYRGKKYTVADIREMAENFATLGPSGLQLLDPPAVLGHEEHADPTKKQKFHERTDQPAEGWVTHVWAEEYADPESGERHAVLRGDIAGVPPATAADIRSGKYRKVSAEVYDNFEDDHGTRYGKALRRVAFLGAEVPQVKRIGDLRVPTKFSETAARRLHPRGALRTGRGTYLCFAESVPMPRAELIAAILAAMPGILPATLDAMSDEQLADLHKNLPGAAATAAPTPAEIVGGPVATFGDPTGMSKEELIAEIVQAGEEQEGLDMLTEDELRELYTELGLADGGGDPAAVDGAVMSLAEGLTRDEMIAELSALGQDPAALAGMSDEELQKMYDELTGGGPAITSTPTPPPVAAMSEKGKKPGAVSPGFVTYAEAVLKRSVIDALRHARDLKKQKVTLFCDQMVEKGVFTPAQRPTYEKHLLKCAHQKAVHKFSEKIASAKDQKQGGKDADAKEFQKVETFCEQFGETMVKSGMNVTEFKERFKELRKKNPQYTAEEHTGQR